jgi:hypothetical protein
MFILAIFLISFYFLIYIFMSIIIKMYFFSTISNILNLFKYTVVIDIYLDRALYSNVIIKNYFLKSYLKNKNKSIDLFYFLNNNINNLLFFNILNFFLILKKNLFKILKNNKLIYLKNKIKKCEIIL